MARHPLAQVVQNQLMPLAEADGEASPILVGTDACDLRLSDLLRTRFSSITTGMEALALRCRGDVPWRSLNW